jgi:hypothetical protein
MMTEFDAQFYRHSFLVSQSTVTDILGLNGCTGKFRGQTANKWSVRKKKDHVDAVLTEELKEEEQDWVTYSHDELQVHTPFNYDTNNTNSIQLRSFYDAQFSTWWALGFNSFSAEDTDRVLPVTKMCADG